MARKVCRAEFIDLPPPYFASKKEVHDWMRRNPGELQSWEYVDPIEELADLARKLDVAELRLYSLSREE